MTQARPEAAVRPPTRGPARSVALVMIGIVGVLVVAVGIVAGRDSTVAESSPSTPPPSLAAGEGEPNDVPAAATVVTTETVVSTVTEAVVETVTSTVTAFLPGAVVAQQPPIETTAQPTTTSYANCDEARDANVAPLHRGEPGYRPGLDKENDGIACE